jgi:chromate reductase
VKILGISGSLRAGSYNTLLLNNAATSLEDPHSLEIFGLADIPFYNEDLEGEQRPAPVQSLLDAIDGADALLFATPEYNHSVPGVLKNAIDWASRPAFDCVLGGKPTGIVSAAMSPVGGARVQMHLKDVLCSTLTPLYPAPDYMLPMAQNAFDADGILTDATAARRLRRYLAGLVNWAGDLLKKT